MPLTLLKSPLMEYEGDELLAQYTDEHGIPMLFDVVLPGDQLREAGIVLAAPAETGAATDPRSLELDRRIRLAVEAALPKVSERTVQNALREPAK